MALPLAELVMLCVAAFECLAFDGTAGLRSCLGGLMVLAKL